MIPKPSSWTWNVRIIEPFEEMYLAKLSTRDISRLLHVSKSKVAKIIKQLGLSRDRMEARALSKPEQVKGFRGKARTARESRHHARDIVEEYQQVKLSSSQHVHHKDNNPFNNAINNLEVKTASQHMKDHAKNRKENK